MSNGFILDPRLAADCHVVVDLTLSRVLLMDDSRWPWLILVPQRPGMREIDDLLDSDRHRLLDEITLAGRVLRRLHRIDKLNVAALGNVVAQLHVHVIARRHDDVAWPAPVWGRGDPLRHAAVEVTLDALRAAFAE